ncbi:DUF6049 family protein [Tessaracoccus antarcticus]|uniref:DUF6049 family protein n=1 Tax=Tessaracoccus antarcticus TaxID=2479848 RepID=UPI000EF8DC62|nr:DUF6049 family protein [Tessaracoccus antarcticus]
MTPPEMMDVYDGAVPKAPWILRALVASALVIPALAFTASLAHAEGPALFDVSITANSTPVMDLSNPEQVVELSGTIINTSTSRTRYTTVEFWKSTTPITTDSALAETLESPATVPEGERETPYTEESGHTQVISREDWFETGERASFTVHATVGELGFDADNAAYLVGVQVRGIPEEGDKQVVGRGRILVAAATAPLESSRVVALTAKPQRTKDGGFVDDSLATSLSNDLGELLAAAEAADSTVLLDPMLLMDVRALSEEHMVNGVLTPADEVAGAWAGRMDTLISDGRVLRLPWGDVDLPRAEKSGHLREALQWADDAVTDDTLRRLPLAANLGASASPDLVKELGELGVTTVFALNTSGGSIGPVRVVQVDDVALPGMGPGGDNTTAQQLGRRVAQEAVASTPPTYLARSVAEATTAKVLPAHRTGVAIPSDDAAATFTDAVDAPLWEALSTRVATLMDNASFRRDLTGNDDRPQLERVAVAAMSSAFTSETTALAWLAADAPPEVDPSKITISAASQFVMGSRTNDFPVSITNGLDVAVTLRLVFDSESPQRIAVPATEFKTLEPGENLTMILAPQASSNGVVTVHGHMETRGGARFGTPVAIDITATEFGRVGWIIIIVSGAVVLGGTVWRIRAVQAERSKEDA